MKNTLKKIETDKAPQPVGPYSQAILAGGFLYAAGQIGLNPQTNQLVEGGIEEETKQVLENLKEVLSQTNLNLSDVVRTDIFVKDIKNFTRVNEIYTSYFTNNPQPARQTVEVSNLPKGALVEISCIAYLKGKK